MTAADFFVISMTAMENMPRPSGAGRLRAVKHNTCQRPLYYRYQTFKFRYVMVRKWHISAIRQSPLWDNELADYVYAIASAALGGKQFLIGQFDEQLFGGITIRQAVDAADADGDHAMRGIAVRDAEHAHLFA